MTTTTTNMAMVLPVPGTGGTAGPAYASLLVAALNDVLDSHDHTSGKGVRIPTAGININEDLEFNGYAAKELNHVKFNSLASVLTGGTNINQIYFTDGDLYANDSSGNQIRITSGGAVNVSGSNGIGGDYGGGDPATLTYTAASDLYSLLESPGNRADILFRGFDMDGHIKMAGSSIASSPTLNDTDNESVLYVNTTASRTITLPDPTSAPRMFIIVDISGQSETNPITLARNGSENIQGVASNYELSDNYGSWFVISDGTDWWVIVRSEQDKTSVTEFQGSTTAGSDTIPTSWASPTLSAASNSSGTAVSRATNTLTFPFTGRYRITMTLGKTAVSGGSDAIGIRLRNTTDGTTNAKAPSIREDSNGTAVMLANITDIAKDFEIQWCTDGGTATVTTEDIDSEALPRWVIEIERVGD